MVEVVLDFLKILADIWKNKGNIFKTAKSFFGELKRFCERRGHNLVDIVNYTIQLLSGHNPYQESKLALEQAKKAIEQLEIDKNKIIEGLKEENKKLREDNARLNGIIEVKNEQIHHLQRELQTEKEKNGQVETLKTDRARLERELSDAKDKKYRLKGELKTEKEKNGQFEALKRDHARVEKKVDTKREKILQQREKRRAMREEVRELLEESKQTIKENKEEIKALIEEQKSTLAESRSKYKNLKQEYKIVTKENDQLREDLRRGDARYSRLKDEHGRVVRERDRLRANNRPSSDYSLNKNGDAQTHDYSADSFNRPRHLGSNIHGFYNRTQGQPDIASSNTDNFVYVRTSGNIRTNSMRGSRN
jgi:chromosome segregation ATPase